MVTWAYNLNAQSNNDIYIIGTSVTASGSDRGIKDGFRKYVPTKRPTDFMYIIGSISNDYYVWLDHASLNNVSESKEIMQVVSLPLSQLSSFNVIDIDEFIRTKTRAQVWAWMMANDGKKIWVIDRNDFYKSSPSLPANDRMKLIETRVWLDNIPDNVLNPL